ncbi:MAG: nicotinamide mononucleotide transporter [Streptomycetaceae bacterium]|nr:nicotinamide mononucleotide transporter [Streptomycetaceae bacterium]
MNAWDATMQWLREPAFTVFGQSVIRGDLLGNIFALATVGLALRRTIWSWPVQITGSLLLMSVYWSYQLGGSFSRQILIIAMAGYGWSRWARGKRTHGEIAVRFATARERAALLGAMVLGTAAFALVLAEWGVVWDHRWWMIAADAYIFVGTAVATVAQARGLVEFWAVWIAVDLVGVPLTFANGLVFSGLVYGIFLGLVLAGLRDWWRRSTTAPRPAGPAFGGQESTAAGARQLEGARA